jgi:N-acetylmuramoyl-L-alanine amidase
MTMDGERLRPDSPVAVKVFPSPNHGSRRGRDGEDAPERAPDMLVLHYTGMADSGAALKRLCDPTAEVSAHYLVFENGHVLQLVPENRRAWHAGAGGWAGETDINSASIGIEIAHPGHEGAGSGPLAAYPDAQIASVIRLAGDVVARWRIPPQRVLAHSDVAPTRKTDPGETFPWRRLAEAGIGHFVDPAPLRDGRFLAPGEEGQPVEALQAMLGLYGYELPVTGRYDGLTQAVVRAFQRHFRPRQVDGVADASTITTLRDLIASQPATIA